MEVSPAVTATVVILFTPHDRNIKSNFYLIAHTHDIYATRYSTILAILILLLQAKLLFKGIDKRHIDIMLTLCCQILINHCE